MDDRSSLKPVEGANRALRQRLSLRDELVLALFPTAVVLGVLMLVEVLSEQRLLFASLASSAFLIYLTRSTAPTGCAPLRARSCSRRPWASRRTWASAPTTWLRAAQ